jgi:hypothetical protein
MEGNILYFDKFKDSIEEPNLTLNESRTLEDLLDPYKKVKVYKDALEETKLTSPRIYNRLNTFFTYASTYSDRYWLYRAKEFIHDNELFIKKDAVTVYNHIYNNLLQVINSSPSEVDWFRGW